MENVGIDEKIGNTKMSICIAGIIEEYCRND